MVLSEWVNVAAAVLVMAGFISILFYQLLTGVPPMPSRAVERQAAVQLLSETSLCAQSFPSQPGVIYELGSGWGGLALALARAFPNHQVIGMELSWLPFWVSRIRCRKQKNVLICRKDFLRAELPNAAAVVCYLMMGPMPKLEAHLNRCLKKGVPVVSLAFWFRGRTPDQAFASSGPGVALYFW